MLQITMINFTFKKDDQPKLEIEPQDIGYYKYRKKFSQIEYGLTFSPFFKNALIWFYIIFSGYILYIFTVFLNTSKKQLSTYSPLFLQDTLYKTGSMFLFFEIGTICFMVISLITAYILYYKYRKLAEFIILINMISNIIFIIGVYKSLSIFI